MQLHQSTKKLRFKRKEFIMKKNFKEIAAQCERIFNLYLKGYGTEKMREKVESIFFSFGNVALNF